MRAEESDEKGEAGRRAIHFEDDWSHNWEPLEKCCTASGSAWNTHARETFSRGLDD